MSVNIGNSDAEQFSNYRKTIDGTDEKGKTENDLSDEDEKKSSEHSDEEDETETVGEIEEKEFKEEINHNFPLSGGGTPLDI